MSDTALLSNNADITSFQYAGENIRFRTSPRLERYIEVKQWDGGDIVVTARYKGVGDTEEYIASCLSCTTYTLMRTNFFNP